VYLTAKQTGRLVFRVEHPQLSIKTYCNNLTPFFPNSMNRENDASNLATVKLDVRKLSAILNLTSLPWDDANIYIVHNKTVLISVSLPSFGGSGAEGGAVDFYLPVLFLNGDEDEDQVADVGGGYTEDAVPE
jgi:hypothetical protein